MSIKHEIVQLTPKLPFKYYIHDQNTPKKLLPHWHQNLELSFLISNNQIYFKENETDFIFKQGDIWLVNSRDVHSSTIKDTNSLFEFCLIIDFNFLKKIYPNIDKIKFELNGKPKSIKKLLAYQELEKQLSIMIQLIQNHSNDVTDLNLIGRFYLILSILINDFSYEDKSSKIDLNDNLIDRALVTINNNYMTNINSELLADQLNTSVTTLNQQFHQAVQMPIGKYIKVVRLLNAQKELLNTTNNIDYIALNCGFPSTKTFIRNFKKWQGITPFHYRKKYIH